MISISRSVTHVFASMTAFWSVFSVPPCIAQESEMVWNLAEIVRSQDNPVLLKNSNGTLFHELEELTGTAHEEEHEEAGHDH